MSIPNDPESASEYANSTYDAPCKASNAQRWEQPAIDALSKISGLLNQMLVLAQQSASEDAADRAALQAELESLQDEIDRIADGIDWTGGMPEGESG